MVQAKVRKNEIPVKTGKIPRQKNCPGHWYSHTNDSMGVVTKITSMQMVN